ncbi:hypothetical protein AGR7B_Cc270063 [Agrobacterium deltaense RV3]|nr:hypothetical protein AGR7B_Cc270063 [Agrobacterium deltaense RV3]
MVGEMAGSGYIICGAIGNTKIEPLLDLYD